MKEINIIQFFLKGTNKLEICRLLDLKFDYVSQVIDNYNREPYIVRQSKINADVCS